LVCYCLNNDQIGRQDQDLLFSFPNQIFFPACYDSFGQKQDSKIAHYSSTSENLYRNNSDERKKESACFNPFGCNSQFITIITHRRFLGVGCNAKISSFAQVNYEEITGRPDRNKPTRRYYYSVKTPADQNQIKTNR